MNREHKKFRDEIWEIHEKAEREIVEMFKEKGVERIELDYGFSMVLNNYGLESVFVIGIGCNVDSCADITLYIYDGGEYPLDCFINGNPIVDVYNAVYDYFYEKDEDEDEDWEDVDEDWDDEDEVDE